MTFTFSYIVIESNNELLINYLDYTIDYVDSNFNLYDTC